MKEIYLGLDPVEISYIQAVLAAQEIEVLVFDQNMSSLYGDNTIFPKRLMVLDADYFMARSILENLAIVENPAPDKDQGYRDSVLETLSDDMKSRGLSADAFLGGQLRILQPKIGYRAAMDPVLLAAACPVLAKGRVLDLGAGVGSAGLCYLQRVKLPRAKNIQMTALEIQDDLVKLSVENARRNNFDISFTALCGDVSDTYKAGVESNSFDLVMTNPPYLEFGKNRPSPDEIRQKANFESHVTMDKWLDVGVKKLKQKGWFVIIQRADRVDEIIAHLQGKLGELTIIPLWPRAGEAAKRVIIRGRKAVKGGGIIHPGLCLHEAGQRYTRAAEKILREGQALL